MNARKTPIRRRATSHLVASCALVVALGAISTVSANASEKPRALASITFGIPVANINALPLWIGQANGIFSNAGFSVNIDALGSSAVVLTALASGSVNFATVGGPNLVSAISSGVPIISVSQWTLGTPVGLIASNAFAAAHGLTIKSDPKKIGQALVGQIVGHNGPLVQGQLDIFLNSVGVNPSQVNFLNLGSTAAETTALLQGQIVAYATSFPTPFQLQQSGQATLLGDGLTIPGWKGANYENLVVATTKSYAAANPGITKSLLAALNTATSYVALHNLKSLNILQANLPGVPRTALFKSIALTHFAASGLQTVGNWRRTVAFGVKSLQLNHGATAPEGVDWTNAYLKGGAKT